MRTTVLVMETLQCLTIPKCWRWKDIFHFVVQNGIGSIPIISLSTAFAGIVVTNQIIWHMGQSLHDVSMVPGFTGQFIFRELGIAIPAFLMVAKVGAATTAEIGSMRITEQIDALKLLGINPVRYLVFPRFIAAILSGACLTFISVFVTLLCSFSVAIVFHRFTAFEFLNALRHFVGIDDLICALVKGTLYGAVIPVISCAYGFQCQSGAAGVGTATTQSVVTSSVIIIVLDFLLTFLFSLIF